MTSIIPVGKSGLPMALVTNGAEELIPTVQYGNIRVGPVSVTKYVEDSPDAIAAGLDDCWQAAQNSLAKTRSLILELVIK